MSPSRSHTAAPSNASVKRHRDAYRPRIRLLSSSFRYAQAPRLLGQARLYCDRIELLEWHLYGPRRRTLWLDDIADLDYHPLEAGANLVLTLISGETLALRMREAHLWREQFENWLSYRLLASAKVIRDVEQVAALAG